MSVALSCSRAFVFTAWRHRCADRTLERSGEPWRVLSELLFQSLAAFPDEDHRMGHSPGVASVGGLRELDPVGQLDRL
jgi:hypothetical protein